jgi:hypothetical protein
MFYAGVVAIALEKEEKINFIFFNNDWQSEDEKNEEQVFEVDLSSYLANFKDLSKTCYGNSYSIYNLPGVNNFLLSITSMDSYKCLYFVIKLKTSLVVEEVDIQVEFDIQVKIKQIVSSFDLNHEHIKKFALFPATGESERRSRSEKVTKVDSSWFVIRYTMCDDYTKDFFQFILLNKQGKVMNEDSFEYSSSSSVDDVCIFFWKKLGQHDKIGKLGQLGRYDSKLCNIHVCYNYTKERGCKCRHLATKICIVVDGEGTCQYKVIDSKTGKEELSLAHLNSYVIHHDRKLYFFSKDGLVTEVVFFENGGVEKREIILPKLFETLFNSSISHGDYLLLRVYECCSFNFYLFNFFSRTFKILDGKYFGQLSSTSHMTINTSYYDFHFSRKVSENFDANFPKDLVDIIIHF